MKLPERNSILGLLALKQRKIVSDIINWSALRVRLKRSWGYAFVLEEVLISPSKPLFGYITILLRDSLVTNSKGETSLLTEVLSKIHSAKRLCRGAMFWELDRDRYN